MTTAMVMIAALVLAQLIRRVRSFLSRLKHLPSPSQSVLPQVVIDPPGLNRSSAARQLPVKGFVGPFKTCASYLDDADQFHCC